jgi:protein-disulfide isomerase
VTLARLSLGFARRVGVLSVTMTAVVACRKSGTTTTAQAAETTNAVSARAPLTPPGDSISAQMDRARIQGDSAARVWLVIVSDFQCPYCRQFHDQSFASLRQQYVTSGKVRMAYINFPLPMHVNAWPAAEAAMCAGAQGKFWQMHDALFAAQDTWADKRPATSVLSSIARTVGVDTAAMNQCVSSHAAKALIQADQDRAERAGVNATPTVIIGQKLIQGAQPIDTYRHVLDSAIASMR